MDGCLFILPNGCTQKLRAAQEERKELLFVENRRKSENRVHSLDQSYPEIC